METRRRTKEMRACGVAWHVRCASDAGIGGTCKREIQSLVQWRCLGWTGPDVSAPNRPGSLTCPPPVTHRHPASAPLKAFIFPLYFGWLCEHQMNRKIKPPLSAAQGRFFGVRRRGKPMCRPVAVLTVQCSTICIPHSATRQTMRLRLPLLLFALLLTAGAALAPPPTPSR